MDNWRRLQVQFTGPLAAGSRRSCLRCRGGQLGCWSGAFRSRDSAPGRRWCLVLRLFDAGTIVPRPGRWARGRRLGAGRTFTGRWSASQGSNFHLAFSWLFIAPSRQRWTFSGDSLRAARNRSCTTSGTRRSTVIIQRRRVPGRAVLDRCSRDIRARLAQTRTSFCRLKDTR